MFADRGRSKLCFVYTLLGPLCGNPLMSTPLFPPFSPLPNEMVQYTTVHMHFTYRVPYLTKVLSTISTFPFIPRISTILHTPLHRSQLTSSIPTMGADHTS
ncbi:hypothetical protein BDR07DRAFT_279363 [Suillus spraguei]|nr:hypothetical protein BDR07DRAFT_279363 [Suillus spraguei]